ncbi:hypothetical protein BGW80DRAFT_1258010 [Lactifluus volemus]|nr:hypothetical protein BGW80DRAFT_1258010 [Lactifluus volemus]
MCIIFMIARAGDLTFSLFLAQAQCGLGPGRLTRQKRARKDLIEKGFYPLAEYVALMEKKSQGMDTQDRGTTRAHNIPIVAEVEEAEGGEELLSSLAKNQGKHLTRAHDIAEEEESDGEPPGSGANGQDIHQTHSGGLRRSHQVAWRMARTSI